MNLTGNEVDDFDLDGLDFKDQAPAIVTTPDPIALGGERFDTAGNLIKDGRVIKTKAEVEELVKAKPAEVKTEVKSEEKFDIEDKKEEPKEDEVEDKYEVDKDGNLVKNGEVFKKKGEFDMNDKGEVSIKESGFVNSLVELAKVQGYDFTDEDGKPIEFEDSEAGYFELTKTMAQQDALRDIDTFLNTYPAVKDLFSYLQAGKSEAEFYASKAKLVDYGKQEVPTTEEGQESLVLDMFKKVYNMPEDKAKEMVNLIKDSNNLEAKSLEAVAALQKWQGDSVQREQQEIAAAIQQQRQAELETLKAIDTVVKSGKLGDIQIPDSSKGEFYSWLTQEVKPGVTKAAETYANLPLEQQLQLEYLVFKGMNIDDLVKIKVKTNQADLIKNRGANSKPIVISSNNSFTRQGGVTSDVDDVK